ncbi:MAG: UvrD-helicase domain-containing protein [Verrucomicrobia bacterium]|nr:UvrD-helicase domain-containing protein [Verrucomicrobiota bacterium]
MNFTPAQEAVIAARGNVLVMAGAGTGKTRTLVERCLRRVLDPREPASLDQLLVVTFTEAAAAEIRQRIRNRLEAELDRAPEALRLQEQLALLDAAHIRTLHSFCLELVRQNFYALELDPQLAVLAEDQAALLAAETLDALLGDHYAGRTPNAAAVQELIQVQSRGWDKPIRDLILQLHEYTQTRPDPEGWFRRELDRVAQPDPAHWRRWLNEGVAAWRDLWLPVLRDQPPENLNAHACARLLEAAAVPPPQSPDPASLAAPFAAILAQDLTWPARKKSAFRKPLARFFDDARFLQSLLPGPTCPDPLGEDWAWVRGHLAALLELARDFTRRFGAAKRERGVLDFHDLEQFALRLLREAGTGQPTPLATAWRQRFQGLLVDEYQDINEAQDAILTALGGDPAHANRFLVGDIKQSIYRFRQANPRIFQRYAAAWRAGADGGQAIDLADNFRSHEALLRFINPLFARLMRRDLGGIDYDDAAQLRFGNPAGRAALQAAPGAAPRVEVHLRLTGSGEPGDDDPVGRLSSAEREARMVGLRLRALREQQHAIWDEALQERRPVEWRDMVVLLRSPAGKVEAYAKQFHALGVPLQAKRGGFFSSIEVFDLLSLLQLLDNPLQDVPALAVLRSPLVGLSIDHLAHVRLAAPRVRFWTALQRWHAAHAPQAAAPAAVSAAVSAEPAPSAGADTAGGGRAALWAKVDTFLRRFAHWRSLARQASLARRLELVLHETHYLDWLSVQPRGSQRQANVERLLAVARDYDELYQPSLYRFLQFIAAQQEAALDREPASLPGENAVRLMSIHQSKGLEFPVVAVADLGKPFNVTDLHGRMVLDDLYGLCPQVQPPDAGQYYPSLPHWLAQHRQRAEALGEELRVLYVALTRAQDTLLLAGTCAATTAAAWADAAAQPPASHRLLQASRYLDWLGPHLAAQAPGWFHAPAGQAATWQWWMCSDVGASPAPPESPAGLDHPLLPDAPQLDILTRRMAWLYPHPDATREPAKTTVTALRRRAGEDAESVLPPYARTRPLPVRAAGASQLSAAERGLAHHRFLERMALETAGAVDGLAGERDRLREQGLVSDAEAAALDLPAIARFWASELGVRIRRHAGAVRRELPFTVRLTRADGAGHIPAGEFIVVQGVVDLAVVLADQIWVVDFKTDEVAVGEVEGKADAYRPQLGLYGIALTRIYRRPVTERWLHFLGPGMTKAV